jgi:hypothetical protein
VFHLIAPFFGKQIGFSILVLECAVFAHDCTVFASDCAVLARAEFRLRRFCGIAPCFLHCTILADLRLIFL